MLPSLLDKQTAAETVALTIFLGANDSNDVALNPHQHCPLEEYRQGLKDMVEFAMVSLVFALKYLFDLTKEIKMWFSLAQADVNSKLCLGLKISLKHA